VKRKEASTEISASNTHSAFGSQPIRHSSRVSKTLDNGHPHRTSRAISMDAGYRDRTFGPYKIPTLCWGFWRLTLDVDVLTQNRYTSVGSATTTYHRRRPVCIQSLFNYIRLLRFHRRRLVGQQQSKTKHKRRSCAALWSVVTGPVRCYTGRRRRSA